MLHGQSPLAGASPECINGEIALHYRKAHVVVLLVQQRVTSSYQCDTCHKMWDHISKWTLRNVIGHDIRYVSQCMTNGLVPNI